MPRYALKIEYDGQPFSGWQRQASAPSVQAHLEAALAKLEPDLPSIAAAGRTDAGVHATAQPITFGHHLLAWHEMLKRDMERLADCRARINVLPLGAAALAGTTWPNSRASRTGS